MDESKTPSSERDSAQQGQQAEIEHLEQLLNEGLDDLESGRIVFRDEMRREIEEIFLAHEAKSTGPKRG